MGKKNHNSFDKEKHKFNHHKNHNSPSNHQHSLKQHASKKPIFPHDNSQKFAQPVANTDTTERKLTKQERRNRNKMLKAAAETNSTVVTEVPQTTAKDHPVPSSSVYKRQNIFPDSYKSERLSNLTNLVDQSDPEFQSIIDRSYKGLHIDLPEQFPTPTFSDEFRTALTDLDKLNFYQFDYTQPAGLGTKVARTFVTRCLVGDPGITYKYLGLRMFAHPWTPNSLGSNEATVMIGKINQQLIERSESLVNQLGKPEVGSCKYNLTLINRCFPESTHSIKLKPEPMFEKELFSVSWHADSSLDHYSTIGIYHFHLPNSNQSAAAADDQLNHKKRKDKSKLKDKDNESHVDKPWKVALRVYPNAEGPQQGKPVPSNLEVSAPPIMLQLPDECIYYLLDDFNHHHQHAVIAGSTHRYASTHRVSRTEGHTYLSILKRAQNILNQKFTLDAKKNYIRRMLLVGNELEFEWVRQFYIQGDRHFQAHVWWHQPMQELVSCLLTIEQKIVKILQIFQEACEEGGKHQINYKGMKSKYKALVAEVSSGSFDEYIELLAERNEKRKGWKQREIDPLLQSNVVPMNERPILCPFRSLYELWSEYDFYQPSDDLDQLEKNHIQWMDKVLAYVKELQAKFDAKNGPKN